jgi:hypothetical protein
MLILLFILLSLSFVSLFVGTLMAPFSVNMQTLKESDYSSRVSIMHIPELFLKKWYAPNKLYVRQMIIIGLTGCMVGFSLLYVLSKLGVV